MKIRLNPVLTIGFLLGVGSFAIFEAVGSFQAAKCSRTSGVAHGALASASEPISCTVFGLPAALRFFMNHNEGFFVGGFTFLLVFVTAWLVWATIKLWKGAEDTARRQLQAYLSLSPHYFGGLFMGICGLPLMLRMLEQHQRLISIILFLFQFLTIRCRMVSFSQSQKSELS